LQNDLGSYPPNGMFTASNAFGVGGNRGPDDFVRMFRRAFPRHQEPEALIRALGGAMGGPQIQGPPIVVDGSPITGMSGAEAIYFWLGGFSDDPQFPLSGPGGPSFIPPLEDIEARNRRFEFDLGRLGPRNADGLFHGPNLQGTGRFIAYPSPNPVDNNAQRRINLWQYFPRGSEKAYAYFDASRHRAQTLSGNNLVLNYDLPFGMSEEGPLFAIKRRNQSNPQRIEFVNQDKFQILHPGLDDVWGPFMAFRLAGDRPRLLFPEGPFTGDIADTLTNFTTGTLESAQE